MITLLGVLTGLAGPLSNLASQILLLQKAKLEAKSNSERIELESAQSELEARRAVLIAEAGSRLAGGLNASMRFLLALGPLLILTKMFAYDKVIGSLAGCAGKAGALPGCETFRTDPLDPYQWAVIGAVTGFYFLTSKYGKKQ